MEAASIKETVRDLKRGSSFFKEVELKRKYRTKLIHEGQSIAEVEVKLIETEDAYKLDDVREALINGNIRKALQFSKVYTITPVAM